LEGLTVTLVTVGINTDTETLPVFVWSAVDVAKMKRVLIVSFADTANTPFELILVPGVTAPVPAALELTLHVTAVLGLLVPVTVAVN
jgi:hypothetical protein